MFSGLTAKQDRRRAEGGPCRGQYRCFQLVAVPRNLANQIQKLPDEDRTKQMDPWIWLGPCLANYAGPQSAVSALIRRHFSDLQFGTPSGRPVPLARSD